MYYGSQEEKSLKVRFIDLIFVKSFFNLPEIFIFLSSKTKAFLPLYLG